VGFFETLDDDQTYHVVFPPQKKPEQQDKFHVKIDVSINCILQLKIPVMK
jgi:hypothetical protein